MSNSRMIETEKMVSIKGPIHFNDPVVFDKEVTIYPEAFITTSDDGKITFQKNLNILGDSQVFDINANVEFGGHSIGKINVGWFGAKGYDQEDDTKSFQKALELASEYNNSVTVFIPTGYYYINEQLMVGNRAPINKSINLQGEGMSRSTNQGSSLVWNGPVGGTMLLFKNNYLNLVEFLDFASEYRCELKSNIELRYQIYQMEFRDCSFSGSAGIESSNIDLNSGSSDQVSEISFKNCIFRGKTYDNKVWHTVAAVKGGKANTKNIYFEKCSFLGYNEAAIDIEVSAILNVSQCAFAHNQVDIVCMLCGTLASSNYSEQSRSFFKNTVSSNLSFTTLTNNYFDGHPEEDYVITNGAGSLVLLNNNFGGSGGLDSVNLIKWSNKNISSIYSAGNYFRNNDAIKNPFDFTGSTIEEAGILQSKGDKMGMNGASSRPLIISK